MGEMVLATSGRAGSGQWLGNLPGQRHSLNWAVKVNSTSTESIQFLKIFFYLLITVYIPYSFRCTSEWLDSYVLYKVSPT